VEGGYGKIADGNELEGVLNDIEDCGYGEFPTTGTENVCTEVTKGRYQKKRFPETCRRRRKVMVRMNMEVVVRMVWR
jgi:hypothetical protein